MAKRATRDHYHHGHLRRALLDAALELVREKGTRGFTLSEAARRAGVSSGAPYRHFADRDAVLDALASEGLAQLDDVLRTTAATVSDRDVGGQIVALVRAYVRFALESPARYEVVFGPGRVRDPAEGVPASFGVLLETVSRGVASGAIHGSPQVLAAGVWALVHGVCELTISRDFGAAVDTVENAEELATRSVGVLLAGARN
jgi:AcrR family transcriptional regulator